MRITTIDDLDLDALLNGKVSIKSQDSYFFNSFIETVNRYPHLKEIKFFYQTFRMCEHNKSLLPYKNYRNLEEFLEFDEERNSLIKSTVEIWNHPAVKKMFSYFRPSILRYLCEEHLPVDSMWKRGIITDRLLKNIKIFNENMDHYAHLFQRQREQYRVSMDLIPVINFHIYLMPTDIRNKETYIFDDELQDLYSNTLYTLRLFLKLKIKDPGMLNVQKRVKNFYPLYFKTYQKIQEYIKPHWPKEYEKICLERSGKKDDYNLKLRFRDVQGLERLILKAQSKTLDWPKIPQCLLDAKLHYSTPNKNL